MATSPLHRLLVTDLDGTLLGDKRALAELCELLSRDDAPGLVFATGRQRESAVALLHEWDVRCGDYLIAGVGSEIYERSGEDWLPLPWPPLDKTWDESRVRTALDSLELDPQPVKSPVKVSYVASPADAVRVGTALRDSQIDANIVHSHGDLLDVLPPGVDKGAAVAWIARHTNVPLAAIITCGDTENDVAMLGLPCASIIVGNARRELRAAAPQLPNVYIAAKSHAAGIIEGLHRYGWLTPIGWSRIEPRRSDRGTNTRYPS